MFACLLFREFCELNKTAKLNGAIVNTIPALIGIVCCLKTVWFEFANIKDAKILILHVKSPTIRAAKLKVFYSIPRVPSWGPSHLTSSSSGTNANYFKREPSGIIGEQFFCRSEALPVTHPTVSKH